MKNIPAKPWKSAVIGGILCVPFALLFTLIMLNIESNFGPLEAILTSPDPDQPDVGGSLVALGTFLFVIAAFIINLIPIVRAVRAGQSITAHPMNLVMAAAALAAILADNPIQGFSLVRAPLCSTSPS